MWDILNFSINLYKTLLVSQQCLLRFILYYALKVQEEID